MQYRKFGKLQWKVSALGFGAMRLPLTANAPAHSGGGFNPNVDEPEAIHMIRYAIDHGVNYIDTAYPYHAGNSERVLGKALKDGYREKVRTATKMPVRDVKTYQDFGRIFDEQLERMQDKKVDFYLLHGLDGKSWSKVRDLGVVKWAEEQINRGRIGNFGFSFHDNYDAFKGIIDDYSGWTFCQIQYNYMDVDDQAGRRGVEYAAGKGLGIVVMEPLRGGKLAVAPSEKIAAVWESSGRNRSPAEWGLLWVWNQPDISVVLSGMSTMEQVVQNVESAGRSGAGILSKDELGLIYRVRDAYKGLAPVPCTNCGYCQPCPSGVAIPQIFSIYNESKMYNDPRARMRYMGGPQGLQEDQRADQCIECGTCLDACPQKIPVTDWLKKIHAELGAR